LRAVGAYNGCRARWHDDGGVARRRRVAAAEAEAPAEQEGKKQGRQATAHGKYPHEAMKGARCGLVSKVGDADCARPSTPVSQPCVPRGWIWRLEHICLVELSLRGAKRRSNPAPSAHPHRDCFASLAMTAGDRLRQSGRSRSNAWFARGRSTAALGRTRGLRPAYMPG
jgi:hypothetical protein